MSIALGAWLAAAAGFATGWIATFIRRPPASRGRVAWALLGALVAAVSYGVILFLGAAVALLTFSSPFDPLPALICTLIGCAGFLVMVWLERVIGSRFGLPPLGTRRRRTLSDLLDARPRGGRATMWLGGVGLALLPVCYGASCIVTGKGELGTTLWKSTVEGGAAIALGLGWIGVGAFLHFHFFFGLHPRLTAHSRTGKLVALVVACAGLSVAGVWSVVQQATATATAIGTP